MNFQMKNHTLIIIYIINITFHVSDKKFKVVLPSFSTIKSVLQGSPFSPVCLVTKVFPTMLGMTSLTCCGVLTTCTPPLKLFSLKNPSPLPPV